MDLEPALEALSLVEDSDAGRRLDLICLDVPRIGDDDQVESKKRKIKKSRRRHLTPVSSPLHPDRQTVGSLSLSEDLPVSRSTSVVESTASSKPEEESLEINRLDEEVVSPSTLFSDFFWPQVSFEQQSVAEIPQTNGNCAISDFKAPAYDFLMPVRLGNNARLRAMIDLFPSDELEDFLHTFLCFKGNLYGVHHRPPLVYLLLTNRGIYLMNHVHESRLFTLDVRIEFPQLRHIIVDLNGQGLKFVTQQKREAEICCASEEFTESILQTIKDVCRDAGFPDLEVFREDTTKRIVITKSLANFLKVDISEVHIKRFVPIFCGRSIDESANLDLALESTEIIVTFDEGSFGLKEGMVMYRFVAGTGEQKETAWMPGYFVLADGHIYCYADVAKSQMKFFGQLFNNHCKGCRRLTEETTRPNVIELKVVIDNVVQTLNLATSNETETTEWMVNLLTSVNMEFSENIGHFDGRNCMEKFCFIVLTEDAVFTLVRDVATNLYHVLDHVNICDIMSAVSSADCLTTSFCYLVIEFESSGASDAKDWSLFFVCAHERDFFLKLLSQTWEELFQVKFQTAVLPDSESCVLSAETLERLSSWHRNAVLALSL